MKKLIAVLLTAFTCMTAFAQNETVCVLEIYDTCLGTRTVVKEFPYTIEAPNWTVDGKWLVYNSKGSLYRISPDGKKGPEKIDTGAISGCNNDHCLSFDGKSIGISSSTPDYRQSRIFVCPVEGGEPTLITPVGPSYLHGWSPDGKTLVYCADRGGEFDVYSVPSAGGKEVRLTTDPGLDDGPEYTPDGEYIWFNSVRSGLMQLWRSPHPRLPLRWPGHHQCQFLVSLQPLLRLRQLHKEIAIPSTFYRRWKVTGRTPSTFYRG